MAEPASKANQYRKFVGERNRALEEILQKYLTRVDQLMRGLQRSAEEIATGLLAYQTRHGSQETMDRLETRMRSLFDYASNQIIAEHTRLRMSSYTLAYAGEVEALSRATGEPKQADLKRDKIAQQVSAEMPGGGDVDTRIRYFLQKLRRKVVDAISLGITKGETIPDIIDRIEIAFPPQRKVKRPKKAIRNLKVKEAEKKSFEFIKTLLPPTKKREEISMQTGFIDDDAWQEVVNDYLAKEIPQFRTPDDILTLQIKSPTTGKVETVDRYVWELEKEITQDFVDRVRKGQVDAANDNGIKEFIWIAIIDSKTDKCCRWRDGKTTKEIEKALKGEHSDDKCRAVVPPAHFNCRCDLAPLTEDLPQKSTDLGDFETWLRDG